tara:strand:- start:4405 stop:4677 length:273 start_codon:yes stop_codon:yes gene_type:complete
MVSSGLLAVGVGSAAMLIGLAVVSGIVISVVNDGELHKEQMMASPPPPPPPARRELFEQDLRKRAAASSFDLNAKEHATLASFARRNLKR